MTFTKINRAVTSVDSQPMVDGGILINVLGRLQVTLNFIFKKKMYFKIYLFIFQCDEDPPHPFNQVFVLKSVGNSFYCAHDIFRLGIHDTM